MSLNLFHSGATGGADVLELPSQRRSRRRRRRLITLG